MLRTWGKVQVSKENDELFRVFLSNRSLSLRRRINVIGLFANLFFTDQTWKGKLDWKTGRFSRAQVHLGSTKRGCWIKYVLGKIEFKRLWAGKRERKRDSKCTLSKIAYTWRDTLWIATRISVLTHRRAGTFLRDRIRIRIISTPRLSTNFSSSRKIHALEANKSLSPSLSFLLRSKIKHELFPNEKNSILWWCRSTAG